MFIHVRNDDLDIVRQLSYYGHIDEDIFIMFCISKTISVYSYCSNFYCSHLWYNFTKVQMNKLRITYAMMRLFNLHFRCSASKMIANCNIHSLDAMRKTV